ncbi:MAG: hypothetical protein ACPG4U_14945 [Pseudomonadales bacterium]
MKDTKLTALEIVQLPSEDFIVRKAGEESALLKISLGEDFKEKLEGLHIDLASRMLMAGIEYLSEGKRQEAALEEARGQTIH